MKITVAIFFKSDFRSYVDSKVLSLQLFGDGARRSRVQSLPGLQCKFGTNLRKLVGVILSQSFKKERALSPQRRSTYWTCMRAPGLSLAQKEKRDLRNKFPHTLVFNPAVSHK